MSMKSYIRKIGCLLWMAGTFFLASQHVFAGNFTSMEEAKKGIVEIQAGFKDEKGLFRKVKSGSGFLLSNREGKTYVVTGNRVARITKKEKKVFCEEHKIPEDKVPTEDAVRIIVKGDVTMETSILASSKAKDFAILDAENVINEKKSLRLRDDFAWEAGQEFSLMAFRQETKAQQFTDSDVEVYTGKVERKDVNLDKMYSFRYTAELPEDYIGGVLLDTDGYVVGIPNAVLSKPEEEKYAATIVNEIIEVLDNFSIYYDSYQKDQQREQLENLYKECTEMYESGEYNQNSQEGMQAALEQVKNMQETEYLSLEAMKEGCDLLQEAKSAMSPKTDKMKIVVFVLGGILVLLLLWLILLLAKSYMEKKKKTESTEVKRLEPHSEQKYKKEQKPVQRDQSERRERVLSQQREEQIERRAAQTQWKETEVLNQTDIIQVPAICLLREKTGEEFHIEKEETVIGKGAGAAICIEGNTAVSREHAVILKNHKGYFIKDKGSLNGTFVNEKRLKEAEEIMIDMGDIVRLANERFVVK